jgi:DNA-binding NtrC family response regulator
LPGVKKRLFGMNEFDVLEILIVEDNPNDAELNERAIREVLTGCVFKRVETQEDFLKALDEFKPDIIVSDYIMPSFDGMTALKLTLERAPLTPFIIVTGSMNEDTAVDCMKAGASNYVIKQHLKRLGPAVLHALGEKKIRLEKIKAEEEIRTRVKELEEFYQIAVGRELRMKELKEEMEELKEELAKYKKMQNK